MFDSTENDALLLQELVIESWFTLLASIQLAESEVKDASLRAATRKDKGKVSLMAMTRSTVIPNVASDTKEIEDNENRKRCNEDSRVCVRSQ